MKKTLVLILFFLLFSSIVGKPKIKRINHQDEWKEVCISTNCGTIKKIKPSKKKNQPPRRIYPLNPNSPFGQKKRSI